MCYLTSMRLVILFNFYALGYIIQLQRVWLHYLTSTRLVILFIVNPHWKCFSRWAKSTLCLIGKFFAKIWTRLVMIFCCSEDWHRYYFYVPFYCTHNSICLPFRRSAKQLCFTRAPSTSSSSRQNDSVWPSKPTSSKSNWRSFLVRLGESILLTLTLYGPNYFFFRRFSGHNPR